MKAFLLALTISLVGPVITAQEKLVSVDHAGFEELKNTHSGLQILDVRSNKEFQEGYIAGAKNITHTDIDTILSSIKKDKPVILYCRSGRRAGLVAEQLLAKGYTAVYHLEGDMKGWLAANKPVVKAPE